MTEKGLMEEVVYELIMFFTEHADQDSWAQVSVNIIRQVYI
jgi:hypothetical protein